MWLLNFWRRGRGRVPWTDSGRVEHKPKDTVGFESPAAMSAVAGEIGDLAGGTGAERGLVVDSGAPPVQEIGYLGEVREDVLSLDEAGASLPADRRIAAGPPRRARAEERIKHERESVQREESQPTGLTGDQASAKSSVKERIASGPARRTRAEGNASHEREAFERDETRVRKAEESLVVAEDHEHEAQAGAEAELRALPCLTRWAPSLVGRWRMEATKVGAGLADGGALARPLESAGYAHGVMLWALVGLVAFGIYLAVGALGYVFGLIELRLLERRTWIATGLAAVGFVSVLALLVAGLVLAVVQRSDWTDQVNESLRQAASGKLDAVPQLLDAVLLGPLQIAVAGAAILVVAIWVIGAPARAAMERLAQATDRLAGIAITREQLVEALEAAYGRVRFAELAVHDVGVDVAKAVAQLEVLEERQEVERTEEAFQRVEAARRRLLEAARVPHELDAEIADATAERNSIKQRYEAERRAERALANAMKARLRSRRDLVRQLFDNGGSVLAQPPNRAPRRWWRRPVRVAGAPVTPTYGGNGHRQMSTDELVDVFGEHLN